MLRQHPHHSQEIHNISSKTRNALADDKRDLPGPTILYHSIELIPMLERCAADTLIGIDANKNPVGMPRDEFLIVLPLDFKRGRLPGIIRRNADIDCHQLPDIVVVIIRRLDAGVVFVFILIELQLDTLPNTFPALLLTQPRIIHPIHLVTVLAHHPAMAADQAE